MRYFLDCEFLEDGKTIDLISIGLVSEDGHEYYGESNEFDLDKAYKNIWVKENVLVNLSDFLDRNSLSSIKNDIINFTLDDPSPEFWGYYCSYDWVVFCQLFGNMINLPEKYPMYCNDIRQLIRQLGTPKDLPVQLETPYNHHALLGARWNKIAYEYLVKHYDSLFKDHLITKIIL